MQIPPCRFLGPSTEHHILSSVWTDTLNYTQNEEIRMEKGQETGPGVGERTGKEIIMASKYLYWQKGADCSSWRQSFGALQESPLGAI